jgi:hypothetical protein
MAIQVMADLESEKFQGSGRGCGSGTMRANDKHGRTLSPSPPSAGSSFDFISCLIEAAAEGAGRSS